MKKQENKKSQSQQAVGYFLSLKLGRTKNRSKLRGMKPSLSNQSREKNLEKELRKVFPNYDKLQKKVSDTEWQRWTPFLSLYRVAVDSIEERAVRGSMHSKTYLIANMLFDLTQISGLVFSFYELSKML